MSNFIKQHLKEIFTDTCLIVLPADLLYLYYAGGWQEPILVILYAELVLLYGLPLFSIWRLYNYLRKEVTDGD